METPDTLSELADALRACDDVDIERRNTLERLETLLDRCGGIGHYALDLTQRGTVEHVCMPALHASYLRLLGGEEIRALWQNNENRVLAAAAQAARDRLTVEFSLYREHPFADVPTPVPAAAVHLCVALSNRDPERERDAIWGLLSTLGMSERVKQAYGRVRAGLTVRVHDTYVELALPALAKLDGFDLEIREHIVGGDIVESTSYSIHKSGLQRP